MPLPAFVVPGAISLGETLLSYLGGKRASSQYEDQQRELMASLDEYEKRARQTALDTLMKALSQRSTIESRNATRRAISQGRGGQSEAYAIPARTAALSGGADAIRNLLLGITDRFNNARIQTAMQRANAPVNPSVADYLAELFGSGSDIYNIERILSALPKYDANYNQGDTDFFGQLASGNVAGARAPAFTLPSGPVAGPSPSPSSRSATGVSPGFSLSGPAPSPESLDFLFRRLLPGGRGRRLTAPMSTSLFDTRR
jgi:hypothetical protein